MVTVISEGRIVNLDRSPSFETALVSSVDFYNNRTLDYAAIFRTQPNVRMVVDFLARNIAQLGVHLYDRVDDTDRVRVTDHPFPRRLTRPNPADRRSSRYRFIYGLVAKVCIFDTAIGVFVGDHPTDGPALITLPTTSVRLAGSNWLWPDSYKIRRAGGDMTLPPDAVYHLQGSLNLDDERMGVSPIESLRHTLAEDASAGQYREQFWKSGARVSGFLKRPVNAPRWKPGAKDRFIRSFRTAYAGDGPQAGGTPLLEDGMEFEQAGVSARESQYLEARKLTREEVAAAYHVHPAFVGILEHANFANMREQHRSLYMDTLGPWLTMLDLDYTNQILPVYEADPVRLADLYVETNFREKLRGSLEEEAQAITQLVGAPVLVRNEGRALLNRNALPGGDELITPLNVIVGGQTVPGEAPPGDEPRDTSGNGTTSRSAGVKALALPDALNDNQVAMAEGQLTRYFNRLGASVMSTHGARPWSDPDELFDRERWDGELAIDLAGIAQVTADAYAEMLAEAWDFNDYDPDAVIPLIVTNAGVAATAINDSTAADIVAALREDDPGEALAHMFDVAAGSRAAQIAQTRTTWAGNFGRNEVARQSGRTTKTWRLGSGNPRSAHVGVSGETVDIGARFSNGMLWPGDSAGGAANIANCRCSIDFD